MFFSPANKICKFERAVIFSDLFDIFFAESRNFLIQQENFASNLI